MRCFNEAGATTPPEISRPPHTGHGPIHCFRPFDRLQTAALRGTFELLRNSPLDRNTVRRYFNIKVLPAYPDADFNALVRVLTDWGLRIHRPQGSTRIRLYPQQLVRDARRRSRKSRRIFVVLSVGSNRRPRGMPGIGISEKRAKRSSSRWKGAGSMGLTGKTFPTASAGSPGTMATVTASTFCPSTELTIRLTESAGWRSRRQMVPGQLRFLSPRTNCAFPGTT